MAVVRDSTNGLIKDGPSFLPYNKIKVFNEAAVISGYPYAHFNMDGVLSKDKYSLIT